MSKIVNFKKYQIKKINEYEKTNVDKYNIFIVVLTYTLHFVPNIDYHLFNTTLNNYELFEQDKDKFLDYLFSIANHLDLELLVNVSSDNITINPFDKLPTPSDVIDFFYFKKTLSDTDFEQ